MSFTVGSSRGFGFVTGSGSGVVWGWGSRRDSRLGRGFGPYGVPPPGRSGTACAVTPRGQRHESAFELCLQPYGQSISDPTASSEPEVALSPVRVIRQGERFSPMEHQMSIRTAVA